MTILPLTLAYVVIICVIITACITLELMQQKLFKISIRYSQLHLARKIARDYRLDYFNTTYDNAEAVASDCEIVWFYVSASNKKARQFLDAFNLHNRETPKILHVVVKRLKVESYD